MKRCIRRSTPKTDGDLVTKIDGTTDCEIILDRQVTVYESFSGFWLYIHITQRVPINIGNTTSCLEFHGRITRGMLNTCHTVIDVELGHWIYRTYTHITRVNN